ncbi:MAG: PKD domain-containing protein, partial [Thermoplasmatota archaeon]
YVEGVFPRNCLADDWMCSESGPVDDIHFWGSWMDDQIGAILAFSVAISADIPENPPSIPYSRPGVTLWERTFYPGDWVVAGPWLGAQGWYDAGEGFYISDNHLQYWQYNIEQIDDPFIQVNGTIYWLSISAIVQPHSPQPRWGWKSSINHWNDDAVHGLWYVLDWDELYEPPTFVTSLDLAFVITGDNGTDNHPPNTPSKPVGPTSVTAGIANIYTTSTTDIDGDYVRYGLDAHNDGIVDHWSTYYYPSGYTYSINITFYSVGTYYLRIKAEDEHGAQSNFSSALVVTVSGANHAPNKPDTPSGPSTGIIGNSYTFSTKTTDSDNDTIKYGWDWNGDGTVDEWSGFMSSGTTDTRSHTWTSAGIYNISVKAEDSKGGLSAFSTTKSIVITSNSAPIKPTISGPSSGRTGRSYTYSSTTTDPESDQIYYWFDWADGTNSDWIGPYTSGQTASMSHTWSAQGSYSIKVKVKDVLGLESVWSDPLPISMPQTRNTQHGGSFQAQLGLGDETDTKLILDGSYRDIRGNHILYGSINLVDSERSNRFQGVVSRTKFIIQSAVNNRIINIIGSFNEYDEETQTYFGQWRGIIVGYGSTKGWIEAKYT